MAGKDIIIMRSKEFSRVSVIGSVINNKITQLEAANIIGISRRQIIRITANIKEHGGIALMHKTRGKPSNRCKPVDMKNKALSPCKTIYKGFNPTFASEKLFEKDKILVNPETLRLWFKEAGIDYKKRKSKKHRSWRVKKAHCGEMIQMDGSHHPWFEQRVPECVLMGYIDDATSRIYGRFYE